MEKIFDNNNENVKTIGKLPQVKMTDSSIMLYLYNCSEVVICQYSNVKKIEISSKSLEKDDKLTPQVVCFVNRTLLNETHIANIRFTTSARAFFFCPEIYFFLIIPNEFNVAWD